MNNKIAPSVRGVCRELTSEDTSPGLGLFRQQLRLQHQLRPPSGLTHRHPIVRLILTEPRPQEILSKSWLKHTKSIVEIWDSVTSHQTRQINVDMSGCLQHQHFMKETGFFGWSHKKTQAYRHKRDFSDLGAISTHLLLPFYSIGPTTSPKAAAQYDSRASRDGLWRLISRPAKPASFGW